MLVALLCSTLCDHLGCSPPSSSVHGILQARILEWVAIPFSRGSSDLRMEPRSVALQADFFFTVEPPGKPMQCKRLQSLGWEDLLEKGTDVQIMIGFGQFVAGYEMK